MNTVKTSTNVILTQAVDRRLSGQENVVQIFPLRQWTWNKTTIDDNLKIYQNILQLAGVRRGRLLRHAELATIQRYLGGVSGIKTIGSSAGRKIPVGGC
jgi:hypothetical protein